MTEAWSARELDEIAKRDELHVSPRRADGTLTTARTVWAVRVGEEVYIRSVNGINGAWYRSTRARHEGHVVAGSVARDVAFVDIDIDDTVGDRIDAAYRAKYRGYPGPVAHITAHKARATTLRLVPQ